MFKLLNKDETFLESAVRWAIYLIRFAVAIIIDALAATFVWGVALLAWNAVMAPALGVGPVAMAKALWLGTATAALVYAVRVAMWR